MIKVRIYDDAITIDGHAKRDRNGDATCCAAVSAAVQTAAAFFDHKGYRYIVSPFEDHGGHFMLFTSMVKDDDRAMIQALIDILRAQADTWPDDMKIEVMEDEDIRPDN